MTGDAPFEPLTRDQMMIFLGHARKITQRAVTIVSGEPYHQCADDDDKFVQLVLEEDGAVATLSWPKAVEYCIEIEEFKFPAVLLTLSDADLTAWRDAETAKRKEAEKKAAVARLQWAAGQEQRQADALLQQGMVLAGKKYKLVPEETEPHLDPKNIS